MSINCNLRLTDLKVLKHIINITVWALLGLYLLAILLLHIPHVQNVIGRQVSEAVSGKLAADVHIGRIDLGFLNRLIIDDVLIYDQNKKEMLKAARLSVKIDILPLTEGKVSISSIQIFGAHCQFYQTSADAKPNFQFVLDSLASKDTASSSLDLRINSLIIRHTNIRYDRYDLPHTSGKLNLSHLNLSDISAHVLLKVFREDSLNLNIKKLSFKEHSGLNIERLSLKFEGGKQRCLLSKLLLKMPGTSVNINKVQATYRFDKKKFLPATLQYEGGIASASIRPSDIACFVPALKGFNGSVAIRTDFNGTSTNLRIPQIIVSSTTGDLNMIANGWIRNWETTPLWYVHLDKLGISEKTIHFITENMKGKRIELPSFISRLKDIHLQGVASGSGLEKVVSKCIVRSGVGNVNLHLAINKKKHFTCDIDTKSIDLNRLLGNEKIGNMATTIAVEGGFDEKGSPSFKADGIISRLNYNGYEYNNIDVDGYYSSENISGKLIVSDPNIRIKAEGSIKQMGHVSNVYLTTSIKDFAPAALNISKRWGNAKFDADINADFLASSINDAKGKLDISNFSMLSTTDEYHLKQLSIESGFDGGKHFVSLNSDFAKARLTGNFEYNTLPKSIVNFISNKLPTFPGLSPTSIKTDNDFYIEAHIKKTDWLEKIFNVPLQLNQPITLKGTVNDKEKDINFDCSLPDFDYSGAHYRKGRINITSPSDTLCCDINLTKLMGNGTLFDLKATGYAANNRLSASFSWDNHARERLSGCINAVGQFFRNEAGIQLAQINLKPSQLNIYNSLWEMVPAQIIYSPNRIEIQNFTVKHDKQHIIINGIASKSTTDSLSVDLQGVDVSYILDLVNFHAVDFSGQASGRAYITAPFGDMSAKAKILVNHFKFENGRMGVLDANVKWNKEEKQIDINAVADDGPSAITYINGYVSPSRNYIDLGIRAAGTRLDFIQSFTKSFISHIEGHTKGAVQLIGPLNAINLTGKLIVDGKATVHPLNCTYRLANDTITFVPDEIELNNLPIYDKYGHQAIVSGGIHHKHLTKLSYDLYVKADNLLGYDFHDFGTETFYGTVFASGDVAIHGKNGELVMDVNVTPQTNSTFVYNVATSDVIIDQKFINWNNMKPVADTAKAAISKPESQPDRGTDIPADTYINFLINCTPDATLKLLMDDKTNDYITLNGNGTIRATYYNKGAFNMFGTYVVQHGTYGITIQDIIKKNFTFNEGGTIVFGGDPYSASLNLQAMHTVNGVSLSDLNIGNSFSNNTTRVNCLMNIHGQPSAPQINFDLDMPAVSSDEKQMIKSIINSEDEMNQQVLYLLGFGRFYPQGANNAAALSENQQSQTSLAMQSLLSGTISSQINNVLNSVINNNNWNFGANISTGDEGWNNAEYEGLLSGRLLNNRLLINGQFGYRDNAKTANTSFIGDFDVRYLLFPNGNLSIKVYNQTSDRYFTKSSLNTQGLGLIMKKDFNGLGDLFNWKRKKK